MQLVQNLEGRLFNSDFFKFCIFYKSGESVVGRFRQKRYLY
jgi:hypothetical protein